MVTQPSYDIVSIQSDAPFCCLIPTVMTNLLHWQCNLGSYITCLITWRCVERYLWWSWPSLHCGLCFFGMLSLYHWAFILVHPLSIFLPELLLTQCCCSKYVWTKSLKADWVFPLEFLGIQLRYDDCYQGLIYFFLFVGYLIGVQTLSVRELSIITMS